MKLILAIALIATPALAQVQTQCFQTSPGMVQCQSYGQPVQAAPVYPSTSDVLIRQLLQGGTVVPDAMQEGQHQAQCRQAAALNVYVGGC